MLCACRQRTSGKWGLRLGIRRTFGVSFPGFSGRRIIIAAAGAVSDLLTIHHDHLPCRGRGLEPLFWGSALRVLGSAPSRGPPAGTCQCTLSVVCSRGAHLAVAPLVFNLAAICLDALLPKGRPAGARLLLPRPTRPCSACRIQTRHCLQPLSPSDGCAVTVDWNETMLQSIRHADCIVDHRDRHHRGFPRSGKSK